MIIIIYIIIVILFRNYNMHCTGTAPIPTVLLYYNNVKASVTVLILAGGPFFFLN